MLFKVYLRKVNTDLHSKPFSEDWEMEITPQEGSYVLYDGDSTHAHYKVHKVFPTHSSSGRKPEYAGMLLVEQILESEFVSAIKKIPAFSGFADTIEEW